MCFGYSKTLVVIIMGHDSGFLCSFICQLLSMWSYHGLRCWRWYKAGGCEYNLEYDESNVFGTIEVHD